MEQRLCSRRRRCGLVPLLVCVSVLALPIRTLSQANEGAASTRTAGASAAAPNFFEVGYDYAQKGDYAVAVELYRTGLTLDPKNQGAHFLLGEALEALGGHQEEVLAEYKIAHDLNRASEKGVLALARIVQLEQSPTSIVTLARGNSDTNTANLRDADLQDVQKAAVQGNAAAQAELGVRYQIGKGVPKDEEQAVKWYRKAAEQGNALGQNNLGSMYALGRGVPQSDSEALKWIRKSAEQGEACGQDNLGSMYELGRGVPQSDTEAVNWYRKSAEQGWALGQNNLGRMYEQGLGGLQKDETQAVTWYTKAARQGNQDAQRALSRLQPVRECRTSSDCGPGESCRSTQGGGTACRM